jgi:hypothetical protein
MSTKRRCARSWQRHIIRSADAPQRGPAQPFEHSDCGASRRQSSRLTLIDDQTACGQDRSYDHVAESGRSPALSTRSRDPRTGSGHSLRFSHHLDRLHHPLVFATPDSPAPQVHQHVSAAMERSVAMSSQEASLNEVVRQRAFASPYVGQRTDATASSAQIAREVVWTRRIVLKTSGVGTLPRGGWWLNYSERMGTSFVLRLM